MNAFETLGRAMRDVMADQPVGKASGTPITTYLYSEGGLFGSAKEDPALINAMVGPFGYESKLIFQGTKSENPVVTSLTCISSSGYSQSTSCYDCGKPTISKCDQSACFGRICQQTQEVLFDELGLMANNQIQQKVLYGNITDPAGNILVPQGGSIGDMFTLNVLAAAYNLRREIGQMIWTGNPASNAGGYAEFTGFDLLINTGKADALNGSLCPLLDSHVVSYGNQIIGATGSTSIVAQVSGIVRTIRYRIMTAGFDVSGAVIDIVMSPTLWDCVADAWACEYGVNCATGAIATNDALAVAGLRDRFKSDMFLTVDGIRYPVTLDNGINVTNTSQGNTNVRCSTIYVITRILPGGPVVPDSPGNGVITYGEYQDMNATAGATLRWFQSNFGSTPVSVTDGGRFAIAPTTSGGWCFDARILTKPRIRMLMPQLSGRLTNVCCSNVGRYLDPTGSGLAYDYCGGAEDTPSAYLYGDCWPTHAGRMS